MESTSNGNVTDYEIRSGTSYAAPHVTAALVMLLQSFPDLTYSQSIEMLKLFSDEIIKGKRCFTYCRVNVSALLSCKRRSDSDAQLEIFMKDALRFAIAEMKGLCSNYSDVQYPVLSRQRRLLQKLEVKLPRIAIL